MSSRPHRLEPDPGLRRRAGGTILVGGSPMKILRLSPAGARVVDTWCRGEPLGSSRTALELADQLVASGMFHPVVEPPATSHEGNRSEHEAMADLVTVVIPVKDDREGLNATLEALHVRDAARPSAVIVVDDGSQQPIEHLPTSHATQIIRHGENRGPAAARMTGLDAVETEFVAFIDAGVVLSFASLLELVTVLVHERVEVVAPRIVAEPDTEVTMLALYEARRSPLDLGPNGGLVGPGRHVPFVPTACLVARADHIREIGGFDSSLRFGEDVDLVWRSAAGRADGVRYLPTISAAHPPRPSLLAMAAQRLGYGSAAGPLFRRHGTAVAPVRASWWSLAIASLLVARRPGAAALVWAWTARALVDKLPEMPDRGIEAALLASRGHMWTLRTLVQNSTRTWWPLTLVALLARPTRLGAGAIVALGLGQRLLDRPDEPALDLALGLVDDVSYGSGVWLGAWRARTLGPIMPDLTRWPTPD